MLWTYQNQPVDEIPEGYIGFVYLITNLKTGQNYIGKKLTQFKRTKPPLKGKKLKNDIVDKIVKPTPPKEPKKLIPKPPKEPKKLIPTPPKEPKKPSDAILNEPPKEPKKLPKLQKDTKACKDDEEINPKTGKCVKKCKEDEIRNLETGRCNKIKPPKALKPPKIPTIKK